MRLPGNWSVVNSDPLRPEQRFAELEMPAALPRRDQSARASNAFLFDF